MIQTNNQNCNPKTPANASFETASGKIPYNMTNDYMFRAVLQSNNKVLRDQLNQGQGYNEIKPVIHIGFLNYTLFEECPEFYATYKLINVKNHHVYSDNLTLSVVDLTKIESAAEEDKEYQIDKWAALFKAKTWEELRMIADKNVYLNEASETMYQMSADEQIRKWCRDREEYYLDIQAFKKIIAENKKVIAEKDNTIAEKDNTIAEKDNAIAEKDNAIAEKDNTIAEQENKLAENAAVIEQLRAENEMLKTLSL